MVLRIGHRGASGLYPENTLLSFEGAIGLGVDMVELDVHVCGSGELVVIHDAELERTTDGSGKVSENELSEIRRYDAGNGERIPTLEEVLDLVKGRCRVNIELKGEGTAAAVGELIGSKGIPSGDVLVSSFQPTELYEFKMRYDTYPVGYLIDTDPAGAEDFVRELGGYSVHPRFDLADRKFVDRCHELGLGVIVWTVNEREDILRMMEMGVDGIISDRPDRIPGRPHLI